MKQANAGGRKKSSVNWRVATLAIVSTCVFWTLNALDKQHTAEIDFPLLFSYDPEPFVLVQAPPKTVRMDVTGKGWDLLAKSDLVFKDPHLNYNIISPAETKAIGKDILHATLAKQLQPVRLNSIVDDTVFLDIQRRTSRMIGLSVDRAKVPLQKNCRIVSEVQVIPDSVLVTGASVYVEALPEEHVLLFNEEDTEKIGPDFEKTTLAVNLPWPKLLQAELSEVGVAFEVKLFERKQVEVAVRKIKFPTRRRVNVFLESTSVTISYTAPADAPLLDPRAFEVEADYNNRNRADSTIALTLIQFPKGAVDPSMTPEKYKIYYVPKR
ncbi:MAG: hypothetical protein K0U41_01890 [Gammaproteobacteria bacterium]|nr:hypothetical protein [Gammaproteobacteria bacterium]